MRNLYSVGNVVLTPRKHILGDTIVIQIKGSDSEPLPIFTKHIAVLFKTLFEGSVFHHELDLHVDSYTLGQRFVSAITAPYKDSLYEVRLILDTSSRLNLLEAVAQVICDLSEETFKSLVFLDIKDIQNLVKNLGKASKVYAEHTAKLI